MIVDERKHYVVGFEDDNEDQCKDCLNTWYDEMGHIYCKKIYVLIGEDKFLGGTSLYGRCEHYKNILGSQHNYIYNI